MTGFGVGTAGSTTGFGTGLGTGAFTGFGTGLGTGTGTSTFGTLSTGGAGTGLFGGTGGLGMTGFGAKPGSLGLTLPAAATQGEVIPLNCTIAFHVYLFLNEAKMLIFINEFGIRSKYD